MHAHKLTAQECDSIQANKLAKHLNKVDKPAKKEKEKTLALFHSLIW